MKVIQILSDEVAQSQIRKIVKQLLETGGGAVIRPASYIRQPFVNSINIYVDTCTQEYIKSGRNMVHIRRKSLLRALKWAQQNCKRVYLVGFNDVQSAATYICITASGSARILPPGAVVVKVINHAAFTIFYATTSNHMESKIVEAINACSIFTFDMMIGSLFMVPIMSHVQDLPDILTQATELIDDVNLAICSNVCTYINGDIVIVDISHRKLSMTITCADGIAFNVMPKKIALYGLIMHLISKMQRMIPDTLTFIPGLLAGQQLTASTSPHNFPVIQFTGDRYDIITMEQLLENPNNAINVAKSQSD